MLLRPNLQLHQADAAEYLMNVASEVQKGLTEPLDMVFVDAFDGNDDVPASLCSSGDCLRALQIFTAQVARSADITCPCN